MVTKLFYVIDFLSSTTLRDKERDLLLLLNEYDTCTHTYVSYIINKDKKGKE